MGDSNNLILARMIEDWCRRDPDRRVLTFIDIRPDGRFQEALRTYQQLWCNGQRVAAALNDAGMEKGDRFAIMMQNHPEFIDAMVGSSIAGTIFVPIDPRTRGRKLRYMLEFAECTGILVADYALDQLAEIIDDLPHLRWIWVLGVNGTSIPESRVVTSRFADLVAEPVADQAMRSEDPAEPMQLLYTSGTTGDPKAILSPHSRFGNIASLGSSIGLRDDDRPYSGLSLTHANAQLITLGNVLKMGLEATFSRKFTKSRLWEITRKYNCTTFNLLGGMSTAIYSEPERPDDADNPVRFVLSAGMPAAIWKQFSRRFGVDIFEFYGAAEGGLSMNPPGIGPVGSIGKPPPGVVARVVDERDRECPPGVQGELVFRNADGSCSPVTYYKNPEASGAKTRGGWFRSGDIGHSDEDGWLYFDYRKGDAIRCNGEFINPAYIEKELAEHPSVDDVFAYGVQATSGVPGECDVVAAIVLSEDAGVAPDQLFSWASCHLERNSVPRFIQILEEIPKTASEKPIKRFCQQYFHDRPEDVFTRHTAEKENS